MTPASIDVQLEQLRRHLQTQLKAVEAIEALVRALATVPESQQPGHTARIHTDLYDVDRGAETTSFLVRQIRQAIDDRKP